MSKKYASCPHYCFGYIPEYSTPPMTVEEYQYYEKEYFGFLNEKSLQKVVEEESGFVERFLQFVGIPKVTKYEDKVPDIKFNVHHVLKMNDAHKTSDSNLDGAGDSLNSAELSDVKQQIGRRVVRKVNKATQTEDVVTCEPELQTVKKPKAARRFLKSVRRFFRRSFKCLKTEE